MIVPAASSNILLPAKSGVRVGSQRMWATQPPLDPASLALNGLSWSLLRSAMIPISPSLTAARQY
jgi:hypothetical protein